MEHSTILDSTCPGRTNGYTWQAISAFVHNLIMHWWSPFQLMLLAPQSVSIGPTIARIATPVPAAMLAVNDSHSVRCAYMHCPWIYSCYPPPISFQTVKRDYSVGMIIRSTPQSETIKVSRPAIRAPRCTAGCFARFVTQSIDNKGRVYHLSSSIGVTVGIVTLFLTTFNYLHWPLR